MTEYPINKDYRMVFLCRWQCHRALRIPDVLDMILRYLSPRDVQRFMIAMIDSLDGRFMYITEAESTVKHFAESHDFATGTSSAHRKLRGDREKCYPVAERLVSGLIAEHLRHRWMSRRSAMGDPISDQMLATDEWNDDAFILEQAGILTVHLTWAMPFNTGDPCVGPNGVIHPCRLKTCRVPRCTLCFRYMPLAHHFASFGMHRVTGIHDPTDRQFITATQQNRAALTCFDCLDDRWPMTDVFTAWGLLAKLIAPCPIGEHHHCSRDRHPVDNSDIEKHASVIQGGKDRSRRIHNDPGRIRGTARGMKKLHRPTGAHVTDFTCSGLSWPVLPANADPGHRIFCAMLAAPKSIAGCPQDPTVSPLFVRKKATETIQYGDTLPALSYEMEAFPAVGEDPVPLIEPKEKGPRPHAMQQRSAYAWDYDISQQLIVKGFGLECKQRREWLMMLLCCLPRKPLLVPDEFYARTMSVFGHGRSMAPSIRWPLDKREGLPLLDRKLSTGTLYAQDKLAVEVETAYDLRNYVSYTMPHTAAGPMLSPSTTMLLQWPFPAGTGQAAGNDKTLGDGAGNRYERFGCVIPKGECYFHGQNNLAKVRESQDRHVPSQTAVPFPHGGSRMWFFFESDIRTIAHMFQRWLSMEQPIPIHRFLARVRKVFSTGPEHAVDAWRSKVLDPSNTDPFWRSIDPRFWPAHTGLEERTARLKACLGQEFHGSPTPASPFPWIMLGSLHRSHGLAEYDALEATARSVSESVPLRMSRMIPGDDSILKLSPNASTMYDCWGMAPHSDQSSAFSPEIDRRLRHELYCREDTLYNWHQHARHVPYEKTEWEAWVDSERIRAELEKKVEEEKRQKKIQDYTERLAKEAAETPKPTGKRKRGSKGKEKATTKRARPSRELDGKPLEDYLADKRVRFLKEWSAGVEGYNEEQLEIVFRAWLSKHEKGQQL